MGSLALRTRPREGDLAALLAFHFDLYAGEFGFDRAFLEHVREPLTVFLASPRPRERLWIAEEGTRLRGCIAIVESSPEEARLRWFLVDPAVRRQGLGSRLLAEAIEFARACGYARIDLWTVDRLHAAARLYRGAGFRLEESLPGTPWGVPLCEERYRLDLLMYGAR